MRLYLANVGVNTAEAYHRGLKSPVFPDRTFEFVPIKESSSFAHARSIPRYSDLPCWTGRAESIAHFLPEQLRDYRAHSDPEFETFTYGDIRSPRASHLRRIAQQDELWFLARLWSHNGCSWTGTHAFYLIGHLTVQRVIELLDGEQYTSSEISRLIDKNAHWRRRLEGDRSPATIVVGDRTTSHRFERAVKVTPEVAGLIYGGQYNPSNGFYMRGDEILRNKNGLPRRFATFGSATRSIQSFLDWENPLERSCWEHLRARSLA